MLLIVFCVEKERHYNSSRMAILSHAHIHTSPTIHTHTHITHNTHAHTHITHNTHAHTHHPQYTRTHTHHPQYTCILCIYQYTTHAHTWCPPNQAGLDTSATVRIVSQTSSVYITLAEHTHTCTHQLVNTYTQHWTFTERALHY